MTTHARSGDDLPSLAQEVETLAYITCIRHLAFSAGVLAKIPTLPEVLASAKIAPTEANLSLLATAVPRCCRRMLEEKSRGCPRRITIND